MAAYIKFDGIDGESKDDKHKGWSDLFSSSQVIHRAGGGATGAQRRRGSAQLEDIRCSKVFEKSSPKIAEAVCKGKIFEKVVISFVSDAEGASKAPYLVYEMKDVMVSSYSCSAGSSDVPHEDFALNFEEIRVVYTEVDAKGTKKGNIEYSWKVEEGKS
jgi:type VI secretion system secreted protein Hcp